MTLFLSSICAYARRTQYFVYVRADMLLWYVPYLYTAISLPQPAARMERYGSGNQPNGRRRAEFAVSPHLVHRRERSLAAAGQSCQSTAEAGA